MNEAGIEQARKLDELFYKLMEDVTSSVELWRDRCDEFSRRTHVRTAFSLVEGVIQLLKSSALLFDDLKSESVFSAAEIILLKEEQAHLNSNGEVEVQKIKIPLRNNFKFATKSYAKACSIEFHLDLSTQGWEMFIKAIKIRDRITHPRSIDDLQVSLNDIEIVEKGMEFFREATAPLLGK